jgi:hypothetical protein
MHNVNYTFDVNILPPADRIIRLANDDIIDPEEFNNTMKLNCRYIQYIIVTGNEKYYPLALIFPHSKLFSDRPSQGSPIERCMCPANTKDLGSCLTGCMRLVNTELDYKPDRIQRGVVINDESLFEDGKPIVSDDEIVAKYAGLIDDIYKGNMILINDAYYIDSKNSESS